jgi:hypothetical protein
MVQKRVKPYLQEAAAKSPRARQQEVYRRYQVFGLLLVAAAILVWSLVHTNPKWIFPSGWWRP